MLFHIRHGQGEKKWVCGIMICSFNIYPKINVAIRFKYTGASLDLTTPQTYNMAYHRQERMSQTQMKSI